VSTTPADARRQRAERELLALAKQLPVPVLSEARHEELRTALLASLSAAGVGSVDSKSRRRTRIFGPRGRERLALVAAILLAGAGIAAAAWRIKTGAAPALDPAEIAAPASAGKTHGARGGGLQAQSATSEQSPVVATGPASPAPAEVRQAPPRSTRRVAVTSSAARESRGTVEIAFARGWSALRSNDFETAAQAFGEAASERDDNALSEDASFWRGVALDRANHLAEAQEALTRFLVHYPRSDRAGEASVMLGWLLLRAGEVTAAEVRFGSALGDPSERVRRSARAGLTASGRRHAD
jgi:TolA-binding protein